jgi:anthranilate synthase component 1
VFRRPIDDPGDFLRVHRTNPARYPFLLESAAHGTPHGRYDLLLAFPGEALTLDGEGRVSGPGARPGDGFLDALDRWWAAERVPSMAADAPPFRGGWFLYLGYELAGEVEPTLRLPRPDGLPVALAVRMRGALVRDRVTGAVSIAAEGAELLEAMVADLEKAADLPPPEDGPIRVGAVREEPPGLFTQAVERAREHIIAGDVFQANLSRSWEAELSPDTDPAVLYARLRRTNPGPFAGLARWGDRAVLSSSPERLISSDGTVVETRPIAGTRPRGGDDSSDAALSRELIAHPKERAEHVMRIDLERNDLGRICEAGTVEVNEMMVIESYAHVHHIVSNVRGRLRAGVGPGEAIRAVFPGGTITGCPKVRCMEIIRDLEAGPRGPYTGSMGWLGRDGRMDLNILIRTIETGPGMARFRAGAGIVFDSEPQAELAETRAKARGLLLALGAEPGA